VIAAVLAPFCLLGLLIEPTQFLRSYLIGWVLWFSVAGGCLGLLMMGHVAPGGWTVVQRRTLEAASRTMWVLGLLFLPVLFGARRIYPWAQPGAASEPEVAVKGSFLDLRFFVLRAVIYFAIWITFSRVLTRMSVREATSVDPELPRRLRKVAAAGLLLYGLTVSFAAVDWIMSLYPAWYSTIFGLYLIGGQAVAAMSFSIIIALMIDRRPGMAPLFGPRNLHSLGKMLLAFVMLWAYFAFSQFLIQWSGNLPDETPFYVNRLRGAARWMSLALVLLHFVLPFLLLLSRDLKRDAGRLASVAALLLVSRWVDTHWLIAPSFEPNGIQLHWLDLALPICLGGVWVAFFAWELPKRPLVPLGDPLLPEALEHG
jgi:hypothetical protein